MTDKPANQPAAESHPLRTSRYDRASSWLLSLLTITGLAVLVLVVVWFSYARGGKDDVLPHPPRPIEQVKLHSEGLPAHGYQLERPTDEVSQALKGDDADIQSKMSKLDAAAKKAEAFEDRTHGTGKGPPGFGKYGDPREIGGDIDSGPPRRWELQFDKTSLETYARQLDFFKIELAILLPDGRLAYACNFTKPRPDVRYVEYPSEKENRYYLSWRRGELQQADRELLARAGIEARQGIILKFLPPQIEARLVSLEKSYAGAKGERVKRTRFGVRSEENGFAFFVLEQAYNE